MLAALLLLGYGFHALTAASPRLTWFFASIIIMVSFACLQQTRTAAAEKSDANGPLRLMVHGVVAVVLCDVVYRCVKGMQVKV